MSRDDQVKSVHEGQARNLKAMTKSMKRKAKQLQKNVFSADNIAMPGQPATEASETHHRFGAPTQTNQDTTTFYTRAESAHSRQSRQSSRAQKRQRASVLRYQ